MSPSKAFETLDDLSINAHSKKNGSDTEQILGSWSADKKLRHWWAIVVINVVAFYSNDPSLNIVGNLIKALSSSNMTSRVAMTRNQQSSAVNLDL